MCVHVHNQPLRCIRVQIYSFFSTEEKSLTKSLIQKHKETFITAVPNIYMKVVVSRARDRKRERKRDGK